MDIYPFALSLHRYNTHTVPDSHKTARLERALPPRNKTYVDRFTSSIQNRERGFLNGVVAHWPFATR